MEKKFFKFDTKIVGRTAALIGLVACASGCGFSNRTYSFSVVCPTVPEFTYPTLEDADASAHISPSPQVLVKCEGKHRFYRPQKVEQLNNTNTVREQPGQNESILSIEVDSGAVVEKDAVFDTDHWGQYTTVTLKNDNSAQLSPEIFSPE